MLSALSVAAAVAHRIYSPQPGTPLDNYLTAVSVALGVFLLAISFLEWSAAYGAKADALHRNAEDLTAYHLKLAHVLARMDSGKAVEDSEVDALRVEYETIKDRCPYNHAPSDHELKLPDGRQSLRDRSYGRFNQRKNLHRLIHAACLNVSTLPLMHPSTPASLVFSVCHP